MTAITKLLIGKKVFVQWGDRVIKATIERIDPSCPRKAYTISWTKRDNPKENIPPDCGGKYSVAHISLIRSICL